MNAFDPNAAAAPDSGIFGLNCTADESEIVIVPVPFAATVSYGGGAERGPAAVLAASRQVDLYDQQYGRVYERGIHLQDPDPAIAAAHATARPLCQRVIERGGGTAGALGAATGAATGALGAATGAAELAEIDAAGELVNTRLGAAVEAILAAGKLPAVLGGDHSVPFGAIAAIAARHPDLGILHVDAHADLRVAYEGFRWSHASIMDNVLREVAGVRRMVQIGIRDFCEQELAAIQELAEGRVVTHFDQEWCRRRLLGEAFAVLCDEAIAALPAEVYVSFDIDGLDPALCPNTGTPVPSGLSFAEAAHLLEALAQSGRRIVGFDLVEVAPGAGDSVAAEWDANVGARLLYKLCGAALRSR